MLSSVLLSAILWTGEIWEFLSFTERYPSIIYNILLFGVTSALGQVCGWTEDARNPAEILHVQLTLFYMSLPDLHFPDCGQLWTSDLLHRHNHKEVLHHPRLGSSVRQLHEPSAVDRHHPGLPRCVNSHFFEVQPIVRCPCLSQSFHSLVLSLQVLDSMLNLANPPRRRHIESSGLWKVARQKDCTSRKRYSSQSLIFWPVLHQTNVPLICSNTVHTSCV